MELSDLGREVRAQDNCLGSQCMLELGENHHNFFSKGTEMSIWQFGFSLMLASTVTSHVLLLYITVFTVTDFQLNQCYMSRLV